MSNILATIRITRDKLYDYYNNGIQTGEVKREKPDDWKIAKVYKFFSEPNLICDKDDIRIYLGNSYNAANFNTLHNLQVDSIINVSNEIPNYFPSEFDYFKISIPDKNESSICCYFDSVIDYFFKSIENGKKIFFVHCYYGASRSAIVVLLLLIRYYNIDFDDAKELLEEKRPVVNINIVFLNELKNYLDSEKN